MGQRHIKNYKIIHHKHFNSDELSKPVNDVSMLTLNDSDPYFRSKIRHYFRQMKYPETFCYYGSRTTLYWWLTVLNLKLESFSNSKSVIFYIMKNKIFVRVVIDGTSFEKMKKSNFL